MAALSRRALQWTQGREALGGLGVHPGAFCIVIKRKELRNLIVGSDWKEGEKGAGRRANEARKGKEKNVERIGGGGVENSRPTLAYN